MGLCCGVLYIHGGLLYYNDLDVTQPSAVSRSLTRLSIVESLGSALPVKLFALLNGNVLLLQQSFIESVLHDEALPELRCNW